MLDILRQYNTQFRFNPVVVNEHLVSKNFKHVVLCGMGGSHLPAGILKTIKPGIDIYVHKDYDLPPFDKNFLESSLLIACSHSGNTAEAISFYKKAKQLFDLPVLCISTGGELLKLAKENNDPYIELPLTQFVPRTALGLTTKALAAAIKDRSISESLNQLIVNIEELETITEQIVPALKGKLPVFYASNSNLHIAYNWKIKCNETAKMHAFLNVFPESNHNEFEGYEFAGESSLVFPVILKDQSDDTRIQKRFDVFIQILKEKKIPHYIIDISHSDIYQKIFRSIILGDLVTIHLADLSDVPSSEVPLIESFKKRLI